MQRSTGVNMIRCSYYMGVILSLPLDSTAAAQQAAAATPLPAAIPAPGLPDFPPTFLSRAFFHT